jgi:NAD(P)-dependent dehydrogenase (short-subunit alcohol dehydrogenase family)
MKPEALLNRTILVTGSTSGIGEATAKLLAENGASLVLTGRNIDKLTALKKELGASVALTITADLTTHDGVQALIEQCPALDGVVHSAGIVDPVAVKFLKAKHLQKTFAINFEAPVLISSGLLAKGKINKNASFVFISSVSSNHPYPGGAAYSASKSAIESFSRSLALEHSVSGIRSNCVAPAMVKTPIFDEFDEETMKKHGENYLLGFGEPIDVANSILFLLSPSSSWITGTCMTLDGGLIIKHRK